MELGRGALHLIALASIGLGTLYCFFGYRVFRILLGILGFIGGASVAAAVAFDIFGREQVILIAAGLVGGIIGAVLMVVLYFVGIFLLGAWLGSLLGVLLTGGGGSTVETVIILVLAVMGGIVAVLLQKLMIIVSTALGGSWSIVSGIFHFVGGGFGPTIRSFQYHPNPKILRSMGVQGYVMLLCWVLLGIAGIIVQYEITKDEHKDESH
jgi:hypothetical protein